MSALILKLIACVAMLIDHTAYHMWFTGIFAGKAYYIYVAMRAIGRIAFPIFAFQIAEGAAKTHNKAKYLLRMVIFSAISEIPFNYMTGRQMWYSDYQNVFFTLTLGLIVIFVMQWAAKQEGKKRHLASFLSFLCFVGLCFLADLLCTDYGSSGIVLITVMGLLSLPLTGLRMRIADERKVRLLIAALAIILCSALCGGLEWVSLFALIPIGFYNGQLGKMSKPVRIAFYAFYPVHLMLLALIFGLVF